MGGSGSETAKALREVAPESARYFKQQRDRKRKIIIEMEG
jgi:hypothetical protein